MDDSLPLQRTSSKMMSTFGSVVPLEKYPPVVGTPMVLGMVEIWMKTKRYKNWITLDWICSGYIYKTGENNQ